MGTKNAKIIKKTGFCRKNLKKPLTNIKGGGIINSQI